MISIATQQRWDSRQEDFGDRRKGDDMRNYGQPRITRIL